MMEQRDTFESPISKVNALILKKINYSDNQTQDKPFHTKRTPNKFDLTLSTATGAFINCHSVCCSYDGIMSVPFALAGDLQTHATPKWLLVSVWPGSSDNPVVSSGHRWQRIKSASTPWMVLPEVCALDYITVVNNARCCLGQIFKMKSFWFGLPRRVRNATYCFFTVLVAM